MAAPPPPPDVDDRVYWAVVDHESPEEIKRTIDEVAQGDDARRMAAVNKPGNDQDGQGELPLAAAVRLHQPRVIGVLLQAGADAKLLRNGPTALAICVHYGLMVTMRKLLRRGHDPMERYPRFWMLDHCHRNRKTTAAHEYASYGRIDWLELLAEEGGAHVIYARDYEDNTPLHAFAGHCGLQDPGPALDRLLALGADMRVRNQHGFTPLFEAASFSNPAMVRALLSRGASADARSANMMTPLMCAIRFNDSPNRPLVIAELLRASSPVTRRAMWHGQSAADLLVERQYPFYRAPEPFQPWHIDVICQLVASGATLQRQNAARLLPFVAPRAQHFTAELAWRRAPSRRWRAHDDIVQLAFDFLELREAEEAVRRLERRVEELEEELRALGCGTESGGGVDDEGGDEEEQQQQQQQAPDEPLSALGEEAGDDERDEGEESSGKKEEAGGKEEKEEQHASEVAESNREQGINGMEAEAEEGTGEGEAATAATATAPTTAAAASPPHPATTKPGPRRSGGWSQDHMMLMLTHHDHAAADRVLAAALARHVEAGESHGFLRRLGAAAWAAPLSPSLHPATMAALEAAAAQETNSTWRQHASDTVMIARNGWGAKRGRAFGDDDGGGGGVGGEGGGGAKRRRFDDDEGEKEKKRRKKEKKRREKEKKRREKEKKA